jgi:hypothetical protein
MSAGNVVDELLRIVERDPLPERDVSSHWRDHGARTLASRSGRGLLLRPSGFQTVHRFGPAGAVLSRLERVSYVPVTRRYRSFAIVWREAARLARDVGGDPDFYVFKSACALALLMDHFAEQRLAPRSVMLIGDGEGFFGALLRRVLPGTAIWSVDLPKQLVFQARMYAAADPSVRMSVGARAAADVRFVLPADVDAVDRPIDLAVAIASMQEMTAASVASYFEALRARSTHASRFYCVARAEKVMPGGEISRFAEYPWSERDEVFIDGRCPFYTHYLSRHTAPAGPRLLGMRVPFVNHFDGVHLHRLARLARTHG